MSKIYYFDQNNSFGHFIVNDKVCPCVFIEADNAEQANEKAEQIGIYFNGVEEGIDCPCCGDRWCRVSERDVVKELPKNGYHFGWGEYIIFYGKDMKPIKIFKE